MADSDNEDEKFVKNVIHELSAFEKAEPIKKEGPNTPEEDHQESQVGAQQGDNLSLSQEMADCMSTGPDGTQTEKDSPERGRQASRIIRLSRPVNPYTQATNKTSTVDNSPQPTSTAPGTATSMASTSAPGSRLAALQRPGSPMHRILARAQSPALAAAAARMNRQATEGAQQTGNSAQSDNTNSASSEQQNGNHKDKDSENGSKEAHKTIMPPRIQSSRLSSSILLRRPQSPLNTNRQTPLSITKPSIMSQSFDSLGPRSPASEDQSCPNESAGSQDESSAADRVKLRHQLRNNSFRLKELLTKPFVRSKDRSVENSDNSNLSNNQTGSQVENITDLPLMQTMGDSPDRTRWRREGISSLQRSKSTVSDRTATLISSKYLRTRTRNAAQSVSDDSNIGSVSKPAFLDRMTRSEIVTSEGSVQSVPSNNHTVISSESEKTCRDATGHSSVSTESAKNAECSSSETIVPFPTTDIMPLKMNMPNGPDNPDNTAEESKLKAISDLERESDVNLVFDSKKIGQPESPEDSEETSGNSKTTPDRRGAYGRSQSEYKQPPEQESDPAKHKINSEPASPHKETQSIRESKSYETTPDLDFANSSPALKRSLAVTDLDQAMKDRDLQKLTSRFRDSTASEGENSQPELPKSEVQSVRPSLTSSSSVETDLDARNILHTRVRDSPRLLPRHSGSGEPLSPPLQPPHSAPPIHPVAPLVYKPQVNLEDAVKWPAEVPGKLNLQKMDVFEGQMLLNWLCGSIDKSHYLRLVMTKHDISVVASQVCTCLIAAGVLKQIEGKDQESVFKSDCLYYWSHTQGSSAPTVREDVGKMTQSWPPPQDSTEDNRPGLKYTEADHQAAMVTLRHEYKEEVDNMKADHNGVLDRARQEYESRLQQAMERIVVLQRDVDKYRQLAGIEKLTQNALSEADRAQQEAGLHLDGVQTNGFPSTGSRYHPGEVNAALKPQGEMLMDLDATSESETSSLGGSSVGGSSVGEGGVPLPPPPPPPPLPGMIPPPPPPPSNMMPVQKAKKPVVHPKNPMKPLFWNRLQVDELKSTKNKQFLERPLLWEEIQELNIDITELDTLFSKTNIEPSRRLFSNKPKSKAKQVAKVISPKRSQAVGILLSSLRMDMSEIEHAILTFDTSVLGEEKLQQIYENRGDSEELKKLREYVKKHPDTPLDKPDQFVYDLSLIPDYAERIFCFIFREAFHDSISVIETKMTNLRMTCQTMMTSINVKRILGLVLTLGNYMNGGSKSRGQADGFGIDILPKLKDVKSKDNSTSLLHFTVQQFIRKFEKGDAGTDKVRFPLPDPSDLQQGASVCFTELEKELVRIKKDFEAAEDRMDTVVRSAQEQTYLLQPFKDIMTDFFHKGKKELAEQEENLADGKRLFEETVLFFCVKPEGGKKEVTPENFFEKWYTFCQDFKDTWKKEQQRLVKIRIRENEVRVKQLQQRLTKQPVRTRTRTRGGLKDRLAKQGLLES
ncbi:uncharacterized protein LOC128207779 isoform X2 [Mya arenaria]|uniref:uncharacterized protein LOC128207779 isoform X2 n=1 Tax=Mya arenaria TaxID=6604 RepID=UPI0022E03315|nr:uncharacterized protein LOC128207779 isoform X2 [Mya arenaria]